MISKKFVYISAIVKTDKLDNFFLIVKQPVNSFRCLHILIEDGLLHSNVLCCEQFSPSRDVNNIPLANLLLTLWQQELVSLQVKPFEKYLLFVPCDPNKGASKVARRIEKRKLMVMEKRFSLNITSLLIFNLLHIY